MLNRSVLLAAVFLALSSPFASGADTPRRGGELKYGIVADPDTLDCHATAALANAMTVFPHYSTLLKFSPQSYPDVTGDLAKSWSVSDDGLEYRFVLNEGVKFHDGSVLTSADVKATYERLRNPPANLPAPRKAYFADISSIETPDANTIVFRLRERNSGQLMVFANPWNCVYSAAKLQSDPGYPAAVVMGTGPFKFAERVKGSSWHSVRFDDYFVKGKPYLDGLRMYVLTLSAAKNALAGGQTHIEVRGMPPPDREEMMSQRPGQYKYQEASSGTLFLATFNADNPMFRDARVRKALALAIDHRGGEAALSKISSVGSSWGLFRDGYSLRATDAEIGKMVGYGSDINAARAEARRLLAEAGAANLKTKLMHSTPADPFDQLGIFVADQWRRVGVTVELVPTPAATFQPIKARGSYEATIDFATIIIDEPVTQLSKYLSRSKSGLNDARYEDPQLDEWHQKIKTTASPDEVRSLVRKFETRVVSEQAHYIPLFWSRRSVVMTNNVQGWTIAPTAFVGLDMVDVWLDP